MFTRRQLFPLFAGAAAVLSLPNLVRAQEPAKELRIGWQKGGVFALAKANGALEKRLADRGIAVSWNEFSSGPPLLEALGANALDFGSTGDIPPLFAQAAGGDLLYVAASKGSLDGSAILVKKDSPIQSLADLKGKKLAFKRGSSAHNFAVGALRSVGLSLGDVEAIDLGPPDAAPAFANGQIDAWVIWDPYNAIAQQDAETRTLATTEGLVESWGYYLANGNFTRANPHVIADLIDELGKVGAAAQANLDDTVKQISQITGVPEPIQKIVLTRKGADLGSIATLTADNLAYQQKLADKFFDLKIVPKKLDIASAFWYPPAA